MSTIYSRLRSAQKARFSGLSPSSFTGIVGIKPTVALTSRAGVVPISFTQDTVGVHGRSIADAPAVLGALTGADPRDAATSGSVGRSFSDFRQFVDANGLAGARIGVARQFTGSTPETDAVFEQAVQVMRQAGAIVIDVLASNDGRLPHEKIERIRPLRPDMILMSGGTDGGAVTHHGGSGPNYPFIEILKVPVVTAGAGYPGTLAHAPNENMRIDLYLKHARHMARLIKEFARSDQGPS